MSYSRHQLLLCIMFSILTASSYCSLPYGRQNIEGKIAIGTLLNGAKFLYTNGLDKVYVKPGGLQRALDDFDFANTAKRTKNLLLQGQTGIARQGKVGNSRLILRYNDQTGTATIQINRAPPRGESLEHGVKEIIVYSE